MAKYIYQCKKCKKELEIEHSIKDDAITHQKHNPPGNDRIVCNGKLKRLIAGGVSFRLRGGGWTPKGVI